MTGTWGIGTLKTTVSLSTLEQADETEREGRADKGADESLLSKDVELGSFRFLRWRDWEWNCVWG